MSLLLLRSELQKYKNPAKAKILARFFKTGKGEYGYGDIFLGLAVAESRKIAIQFGNLPFEELKQLLASKIHEERLIALLILVHNFQKGTDTDRKKIFDYYLEHTAYINNWDLVDLSADKIVGEYLVNNFANELSHIENDAQLLHSKKQSLSHSSLSERQPIKFGKKNKDNTMLAFSSFSSEQSIHKKENILVQLAHSQNLWERRIAMIATYAFIKRGISEQTFQIAKILINDKHDLIQKAVGWMLREVGKRCSQEDEEEFLKKYYKTMPRTMLRYAIERFEIGKRKQYLAGDI